MRVIGVVDIMHGRAVLARAGQRDRYEPVSRFAGQVIAPGVAEDVSVAYLESGVRELYAADLDAIQGRALNALLLARLASLRAPLWIDAGVENTSDARDVLAVGDVRIVAGLETLDSPQRLRALRGATPSGALAFSLDLRMGHPVLPPQARWPGDGATPIDIVRAAVDEGVDAVIVLDLARVGMGTGLDLALLAAVRHAAPDVTLLAGGGVRGVSDLETLADVGCDGALVASAIQDGRIGPADIARVNGLSGAGGAAR